MKTKNILSKNHRRWFNIVTFHLKQTLDDYNFQRTQRRSRRELLRLGDHLLRDIGFKN